MPPTYTVRVAFVLSRDGWWVVPPYVEFLVRRHDARNRRSVDLFGGDRWGTSAPPSARGNAIGGSMKVDRGRRSRDRSSRTPAYNKLMTTRLECAANE